MYQFPALSFGTYVFSAEYHINVMGFPIRKSQAITLVGSLPGLIAAYHVLHRLLTPRHPPYTLSSLTTNNLLLGESSSGKKTARLFPPPKNYLRRFDGYYPLVLSVMIYALL